MKVALNVKYQDHEIKLSAHEVLNIAIDLMKEKWPQEETRAEKAARIFQGMNALEPYSTYHLDSPLAWLSAARTLEQGISKNKKNEIKANKNRYPAIFKSKAFELYKKKLCQLKDEEPNADSQIAWGYKKEQIEQKVQEITTTEEKQIIVEAKELLNQINSYLVECDSLKLAVINNPLELQQTSNPELVDFLDIIVKVYHDRIDSELKKDQKRTIDNFLSTANSADNLIDSIRLLEEEVELGSDVLSDEAKAALYTYLIKLIDKTGDKSSKFDKFKEEYNHYSGKEAKAQQLSLIAKRKQALELTHNWINFYKLYNAIYFARELINQQKIHREDSQEAILKLTNDITSDENQQGMIQGPPDIYSFVKLLIKQGYRLADIKPDALLNLFKKNKNTSQLFKSMPWSEFCQVADIIDSNRSLKTHYDEKEILYYRIGSRLVGVDNHAERYAYDYGTAPENIVAKLEGQKECFTKLIHDAAKQVNADEKFLFSAYIIIAYLICHNFPKIKPDYFQAKVNEICKNLKEYHSVECRKEFVEMELCRVIEEFYFIQTLTIEEELKNFIEVDSTMRSYPDIFRRMPKNTSPEADIALIHRLLMGEKIECDPSIALLTGIWFLSEVSRNPLTYLSNLIILDLMQRHYKNGIPKYTWRNVLWHQDTIGTQHPDGTNINQENGLKGEKRTARYPQEDGWGGKHPMCHLKSWERYFTQNKIWPLNDDSLELVRQKEATLIIRWLYYKILDEKAELEPSMSTLKTKRELEKLDQKTQTLFFNSYQVQRFKSSEETTIKNEFIEKIIKPLIKTRLDNFGPMLKSGSSLIARLKQEYGLLLDAIVKELFELPENRDLIQKANDGRLALFP